MILECRQKFSRTLAIFGAFALALNGCNQPTPPPRMQNLQFPIIVLFGNSSVLRCSGPDELKKMHTNYLTLNNQVPRLIDSGFNIFSMEKLRSVHGGLWLMANPSGMTEVTFELKPQKSGRAEAQRLFAEQLRKQTWRDDQASRLEALSRSQSLLQMEEAISPHDD
jgi:hypothetical protein